MKEQTIEQYLDDLSSAAPEPGGGSATALAAATGAALVSMVCRLTIGRETGRERGETISAALAVAGRLRFQALGLAGEDTAAYAAVTAARKLPRGTQQEREERAARVQEALRCATDIPLATAALAAHLIEVGIGIVDQVNRSAVSDLRVGLLLAHASLEGAALNVRTNLALIQDEAFKAATSADLERYLEVGQGLLEPRPTQL